MLFYVYSRAQSPTKLLFLHEENANNPVNVISSGVFREAFGSAPPNQLFEGYMDATRLGASDPALAESLGEKYLGRKVAFVVAEG